MPQLFAVLVLALSLTSCATLDKTNLLPGQRIPGLGFSFTVPTEKAWFSVVWGNSNRIRLSQINAKDSYAIEASLNRGPYFGMYQDTEDHLSDLKKHKDKERSPKGYFIQEHEEWAAPEYGDICVRYTKLAADTRGRGPLGPAKVETIGLICPHQTLSNVLLDLEITRRSDSDAEKVDLNVYAEALFSSVEYSELDD